MIRNSKTEAGRNRGRVALFSVAGIAVVASASVALTLVATSQAAPRTVGGIVSAALVSESAALSAKAPVYLSAELTGAQEVPVAGGPATGSPSGDGTALVKVDGSSVTFQFTWTGISAPTAGHIHQGAAGTNGPVIAPLFSTPMPDTVDAAAGAVTLKDAALATQLRTQPSSFYANLHTKEFPGGALRGQLKPAGGRHSTDMRTFAGHRSQLKSFDTGSNEVPVANGPKTGDPDGRADATVDLRRGSVDYWFAWTGIEEPTAGHIHQGVAGQNGEVKVPLFAGAIPANIFAVAGSVSGVAQDITAAIKAGPAGFYTNLHTSEFPGGAVRGQLQK
jgi:hypothetical protein